jgi:hypothetical protein
MVLEKFEDLDELWSSDHEFTGWRCLNCGAIVDPMMAAHRRITSSVVASIQALTTKHEALSSWMDQLADHLTVQKRRVCLERLRLQPFALDGSSNTLPDQRNTLLYRTLADEAHPFNSIKEEAPC